jgi:diguanylate cyclase (GGDEF)-like protein
MRKIIEKLGRVLTITLVTLVSIIATLALTNIVFFAIGVDVPPSNTKVAIIVTIIITPVVATPFFNLLFRVFELEKTNRILAAYDPVTGLMSRRAMISQAISFLSFAERKHAPVSMLFIDLDNFKAINDKYGHQIGDSVLHRVGQYINTIKRESDLTGRYGGDEIIALLPDTDTKGAQHFAEKLHAILKENPISANNETVYLTLSIGTTTYKPNARPINIDELTRQSDLALYEAKLHGKNCTASYIADNKFDFD